MKANSAKPVSKELETEINMGLGLVSVPLLLEKNLFEDIDLLAKEGQIIPVAFIREIIKEAVEKRKTDLIKKLQFSILFPS